MKFYVVRTCCMSCALPQIYDLISCASTVLQTRHTSPVLWLAGLRLYEDAERLVMETSEKKNLQACIARAYEQLIYEAEEQRALITLLHQTIRLMVQYYCL